MFAAKNELFTRPGAGGYQISRSVRYRASASPYFTRPFATPTNSSKWTMSMWVKRGILSSATIPSLFGKTINASANFYLGFENTDTLIWTFTNSLFMRTTPVFRDPSAWYHIVAVWDSANATAAQRARLYVNGTEITAFSTDNRSSITTSMDAWNTTSTAFMHGLGCASATVSTVTQFFDGYFTEVNFIDGQALTPTSFGQFNSVTGVWQPIKYTGTYGTNGFYLNFSDNSAATAAAIGKDYSGNGNNWTPNNISVTSGATYDSMLDVPTPYADGGNGRGNYSVLNAILVAGGYTLTNGNLEFTRTGATGGANDRSQFGTIGVTSGKWYWEFTAGTVNASSIPMFGIAIGGASTQSGAYGQTGCYLYASDGSKYVSTVNSAYGSAFATGDVIGVAFDADAGTLTFYKNNVSQGQAASSLTSGPYFPAVTRSVGGGGSNGTDIANFGQRPFTYTPPSGFNALNTQNLPAGTITTSGSFTGNASTDGPFVYLNGVPTAMTINGNAVTFGTNADHLANGFKVRSSSASYNASGSNTYSITTTGAKFKNAIAQTNP